MPDKVAIVRYRLPISQSIGGFYIYVATEGRSGVEGVNVFSSVFSPRRGCVSAVLELTLDFTLTLLAFDNQAHYILRE
ncbi:hypothetical protein J6590_042919 [Homalodisca vitripennis]|nr:hypothetical protein J6590_042919 [Homalodisca vitripennis]